MKKPLSFSTPSLEKRDRRWRMVCASRMVESSMAREKYEQRVLGFLDSVQVRQYTLE